MRNLARVTVALVMCATVASPPGATAAPRPTGSRAHGLLRLINQERTARGLSPLTMMASVERFSERHAATMARADAIFHNRRLSTGFPVGWSRLGENVGYGLDLDGIHRAFMGSAIHRTQILDPSFTHLGIGVVKAGRFLYVVEDFVRPRSTRAIRIAPPRVHEIDASSTVAALGAIQALTA